MIEIRKAGLTSVEQIKEAFMESDGSISVIEKEKSKPAIPISKL
jgi:uncharacterized membrane protein YcaP (DUF421 family)